MSNLPRFRTLAVSTALCLGTVVLSATQASAFTYRFGSTSTSSNPTATGASASVDFDFSDLGNGQVQLNLGFLNTTGTIDSFGAGATEARLNGIAFDLFNDVTVASHSFNGKLSTLFTNFAYSPFSNRVGNFSIGFGDNNQFEGGKAKDGLAVGETSFATLVLNSNKNAADLQNQFRLALSAETLNVAARFQAVNAGAGSDKLLGGSIDNPFEPPQPTEVPEPAALAGLGVLVGYLKHRRRSTSPSRAKA